MDVCWSVFKLKDVETVFPLYSFVIYVAPKAFSIDTKSGSVFPVAAKI